MRIGRPLAAPLLAAATLSCSESVAPVEEPPRTRAAAVTIVDGDGLEWRTVTYGHTGPDAPQTLRARVTDAAGAPLSGVEVVWATDAGKLEPLADTTDAAGIATASWEWYSAERGEWVPPGTYEAVAHVPGVDFATFTGHARAGVVLRTLRITPDTVSVSGGPAEVTVRVSATDDRTVGGLEYASFRFESPPGATRTVLGGGLALVSGTPSDGVWEGTATVPVDAAPGDWTVAVTLGWGCGAWNRHEWNGAANHWFDEFGLQKHLHVAGAAAASSATARRSRDAQAGSAPLPAAQVASCAGAGAAR